MATLDDLPRLLAENPALREDFIATLLSFCERHGIDASAQDFAVVSEGDDTQGQTLGIGGFGGIGGISGGIGGIGGGIAGIGGGIGGIGGIGGGGGIGGPRGGIGGIGGGISGVGGGGP